MKPDYPLLGLLARGPASGYDIGKWLRIDGRFLGRKPSMTPIYRALADLQGRGWLSVTIDQRDTAPAAKLYRLTPAGRQALLAWASSPYQPAERPMAPDFTIRLQFAGQLGPSYALGIVRTELDFRRRQRQAEEVALAGENADPIPEIDLDWLNYIDAKAKERGWQTTSWFIGWLETTERELDRLVRSAEAREDGTVEKWLTGLNKEFVKAGKAEKVTPVGDYWLSKEYAQA